LNLSRFRNDKDDVLTIISPKQQVKQFKLTLLPKAGVEDDFQIYYDQKPLKPKE
jgi:hypothetical protein